MPEPPETHNYAASVIEVLRHCSSGSMEKLLSSLKEKNTMIEQRNRLIEEQRNLLKKLETRTDKLSALHKFEQEHRIRFESQVLDLTLQTEEYKATLEKLKDALELRNTNLTQQQRINNLQDENKGLQLTVERYLLVVKTLEDRVCHGEKQISGLRDERAYLETHNLGLRDELVAKDMHYHREIEETANYYKTKLGPYECAIEVLHALSQQDGEELSVAAYFAQALKLKGLQLHTVGIDEHRADLLFERVRNGQNFYSTFQPPTSERGFRCKYHQNLPTLPVSSSAQPITPGPTPAAPASSSQQPTFAPSQSPSGGQTAQLRASNDEPNGRPQPPFPIEICNNTRDYHNMESPFAVDFNGEYLDGKAAERAHKKIEKWKKEVKKWEKTQNKGSGDNANSGNPAASSNASAALGAQNQPAQQQPSSLASSDPDSDPMDTTTSSQPTFSFPPQPFAGPSLLNQTQGSFGQPAQQTAQPSTFGQPQPDFSALGQSAQQQPQQPHNTSATPATHQNSLPSLFPPSNQSQASNQATGLFGMPMPQQSSTATTSAPTINNCVSRVDSDVEMS